MFPFTTVNRCRLKIKQRSQAGLPVQRFGLVTGLELRVQIKPVENRLVLMRIEIDVKAVAENPSLSLKRSNATSEYVLVDTIILNVE